MRLAEKNITDFCLMLFKIQSVLSKKIIELNKLNYFFDTGIRTQILDGEEIFDDTTFRIIICLDGILSKDFWIGEDKVTLSIELMVAYSSMGWLMTVTLGQESTYGWTDSHESKEFFLSLQDMLNHAPAFVEKHLKKFDRFVTKFIKENPL